MIEAPTNCPSCDSLLEWSNDLLYCRNPDCSASTYKHIEHFATTLKIKGMGPSTIEKLELTSLTELYALTKESITEALGSEKLAIKLFEEIQMSKTKSLNYVLPAFGIPLVGKTASDKLSKVCIDIHDINEDTCKKAGLGEKVTSNLLNWLETEEEYLFLPFDLEFKKESKPSSEVRGVVCISGKLNSYPTKQAAKAVLEELGFIVKDSLTKDVTILVNESGKITAKTQKAIDSGIVLVEDLRKFTGDIK